MSVLKFKDGTGWKEAPAVVAQITKERVLSALGFTPAKESDLESKQDALTAGENITIVDNVISAASGGGAVDDVKIDGTSVVKNGVANIPLASNSDAGVIKVSSVYGMQRISGTLAPLNWSSYIDNRDKTSAFLGTGLIDYAVKAALTDAKGSTYTDEQKLAAQKRLGIGSEDFELIAEATVTNESSSMLFTKDKDGNDFSLKKVLVYMSRVCPTSGTHTAIKMHINDDRGSAAWSNGLATDGFSQGAGASSGTVMHARFLAERDLVINGNGVWSTYLSRSSNETSVNNQVVPPSFSGIFRNEFGVANTTDTIDAAIENNPNKFPLTAKKVWVGSYGACLGVGTKIWLLGVRA